MVKNLSVWLKNLALALLKIIQGINIFISLTLSIIDFKMKMKKLFLGLVNKISSFYIYALIETSIKLYVCSLFSNIFKF